MHATLRPAFHLILAQGRDATALMVTNEKRLLRGGEGATC